MMEQEEAKRIAQEWADSEGDGEPVEIIARGPGWWIAATGPKDAIGCPTLVIDDEQGFIGAYTFPQFGDLPYFNDELLEDVAEPDE